MSTISGQPEAQPTEQPDAAAQAALGLTPSVAGPAAVTETTAPVAPATAPDGTPITEQPAWSEEFRTKHPAIAAKFQTPEALAGSYANLERYFTAFAQAGLSPEDAVLRLAKLNQLGDGTQVEAPAAPAPVDGLDQYGIPVDQEAFMDYLAADPRKAMESVIDAKMTQWYTRMSTAQRDWAAATAKYPDMAAHEDAMQKVLAQVPELAKLPDVLERLYFMVKGGTPTETAVSTARAQTRDETLAQVRSTIVESGRGGASPPLPGAPTGQGIVESILFAKQGGTPVPGLIPRGATL